MRKPVILAAVVVTLLTSVPPARATTVTFAVDPSLIGAVLASDVDLFSSDLNATAVGGQSLALDLLFDQSLLARMRFGDIGVSLTIFTTTGGFPPSAGDTTGFLLAPDGTGLHAPSTAGRSVADDGSFSVGLVDLTALLSGMVDVSGVHFDMILPSNGSSITDARLRISVNSPFSEVLFGTAAQLPEPSTALLLVVSGAGLLGVRRWSHRRPVRRNH